jgi:phosphoribosylformylglycinamidine synthase
MEKKLMPQINKAKYRLELFYKHADPRGRAVIRRFKTLGYEIESLVITDNYLINADLSFHEINAIAQMLYQPVTQGFCINEPYIPDDFDFSIEIGYLPGVTDNVAHTVRESIEDLLKKELDHEKSIFYTSTYFFKSNADSNERNLISRELYNPLIQRIMIFTRDEYIKNNGMGHEIPVVTITENSAADSVDLNLPDDDLMTIAREGIKNSDGTRRGPLALDMASMHVIKDYFTNREKRPPRDIELESIAQTWSEHCKHTIFASAIDDDVPEGIYRRYIKEATIKIRKDKGDKDFCLSVFTDNSGGIEFDENFIVSDKVETHNSPSALDPFGGSITGIVGVNRDSMGFGMGAKPVANRYGFCFADPADKTPLYKNKDHNSAMLPPRRIMEGVIQGVNAGGNTSGIPTPQGFIFFDSRYKGKPLVFVGTVGLMPKVVGGKSSVYKKAMPGDLIVMTGGRVGRDGIHGATFSSEALTSGSPATAVQIGDPITQKKMSDAIIKEARDMGLYNSITDNGAGGLSCSVAEMARECGGFVVDLEKIPLKYPGLSPWQIWVSESQERMTLSVPEDKIDAFINLMKKRGVEATVIGRFNSTDRGIVLLNEEEIFNLDMNFLHDGLPNKELKTSPFASALKQVEFDEPADYNLIIKQMLSRLNICSFEFITSQYDHEVQAGSVIKPLQGMGRVNSNVSVIKPLFDSWKGVVLSQGFYPSYSELDPYRMAACSIDTAVRNAVSAGCPMNHLAILDNFCWCDSNNSERLWQLKRAAQACYDFAVSYGTPYISGKDSMFNDFSGFNEKFEEVKISIPPTLLISSIGVMEDVKKAQTIDFKFSDDLIYIAGLTENETAGSEYSSLLGDLKRIKDFKTGNVPDVNAELFKKIYYAMEKAIARELVSSCISIERGGLGVAAAKSSIAGMLGAELDISDLPGDNSIRHDYKIFSESQGRFLVSVNAEMKESFESCFEGLPLKLVGKVRKDNKFTITGDNGNLLIDTTIDELNLCYRETFKDF